jgi:tape measure domain-containing protein
MSGIIIRTEARTQDAERNLNNLSRSVQNVDKSAKSSADSIAKMLKIIGTISGVTIGLKYVQSLASEFQTLENRIANVTGRTRELAATQKELLYISQRTNTSLAGAVNLYGAMGRALRQQGVSNKNVLAATETLQKAITISGANAQTARAAIMQLGQGLSAGALRGEELNSVMENTPRIAKAIADNLGVSLGNLRLLAAQGKLTEKVVFTAILEQAEQVNKEFKAMRPTIDQATAVFAENLRLVVFEFTKGLRIFERLASIYLHFAKQLQNSADAAFLLGNNIALIYYQTKSFIGVFSNALLKPILNVIKSLGVAFLQIIPSVKTTTALKNWGIKFTREFDRIFLFGSIQAWKKIEVSSWFKFETDLEKAVRRFRRLSPRYWIGAGFNRATLQKLFSISTIKEFGDALNDIANAISSNQNSLAARFERFSITIGYFTQVISRFFGFRPDTFIALKRGGLEPLFKSLSEIVRATVRTSLYFWQLGLIIRQTLYPSFVVLFKDIKRSAIPILNFLGKSIQTTAKIIWTSVKLIHQIFDDLISVFAGKEVLYYFSVTTQRLIKQSKGFALDLLENLTPKDLKKTFTKNLGLIADTMVSMLNSITDNISLKTLDTLLIALTASLDRLRSNFVAGSRTLAKIISNTFTTLVDSFANFSFNAAPDLSGLYNKLRSAIKKLFEILISLVRDFFESNKSRFTKISKGFWDSFLEGFGDNLKQKLSSISSAFKSFTRNVINYFKELYIKVIGNSYWTDTISQIIEDSKSLWDKTSAGLSKFKNNFIETFRIIQKTRKGYEFKEIRLTPNTSIKIPTAKVDSTFYKVIEVAEKMVNTLLATLYTIPEQLKLIALSLVGLIGLILLPDNSFKGYFLLFILGAILRNSSKIGEAFSQALTGKSVFDKVGQYVGEIAGKFVVEMARNIPVFINAMTSLLSNFIQAFLAQIPIIGKAFTAIFAAFSALGLGPTSGLLTAIVFGKGVAGFYSSLGNSKKKLKGLSAILVGLHARFIKGEGWGVIGTALFGKHGVRTLALFSMVLDYFGSFNTLFSNSPLMHMAARGGLLYLFLFGKSGLNGIKNLVSGAFLGLMSGILPKISRGISGAFGQSVQLDLFGDPQLKNSEAVKGAIFGIFNSITEKLTSFGASALPKANNFIKRLFLGEKSEDTIKEISTVFRSMLDKIKGWMNKIRTSDFGVSIRASYDSLKKGAGNLAARMTARRATQAPDMAAQVAQELALAKSKFENVVMNSGSTKAGQQALKELRIAQEKQNAILNGSYVASFEQTVKKSQSIASRIGGKQGLLGRLFLGATGKFVIGAGVIALLTLLSSNAFASNPNTDELEKMPGLFERFRNVLMSFTDAHPIFKFQAKLIASILLLSTVITASIRSVATGTSARGVFGAIGAAIGGYMAYGITGSIEATLMTAFLSASFASMIATTLSAAIGNALIGFLGKLATGLTITAILGFAASLVAITAGVLAAAFVVGAGISLIKNFFFGKSGELWEEMKADWDAVKNFIFGPPKDPVIDTKGLKQPALNFLAEKDINLTYNLSEVNTDRLTSGQKRVFETELKKFQEGVKTAREKDLLGDFGEDELQTLETQAKRFNRIVETMRQKSAISTAELAKEVRDAYKTSSSSIVEQIRDFREQRNLTSAYQLRSSKLGINSAFANNPLYTLFGGDSKQDIQKQQSELADLRDTEFNVDYRKGINAGVEVTARMLESIQNLRYEHPLLQKEIVELGTRYIELTSRMKDNERIRDRWFSTSAARKKAIEELEERLRLENAIENRVKRAIRFDQERSEIEKFQKELSNISAAFAKAGITIDIDKLVISEKNYKTLKLFGDEAEKIFEALKNTRNVTERSALILRLKVIEDAAQTAIGDNLLDDYTRDNFQLEEKVTNVLGIDLAKGFYANLDEEVAAKFIERLNEIEAIQRRIAQKPLPYMFDVGPTEDMSAVGFGERLIRRTISRTVQPADERIQEFPNTPFFQRVGKMFFPTEIEQIPMLTTDVSFANLEAMIAEVRKDITTLAAKDFAGFKSLLESFGVSAEAALENLDFNTALTNIVSLIGLTGDLESIYAAIASNGGVATSEEIEKIKEYLKTIRLLKEEMNKGPITLDNALSNVNSVGFSFDKRSLAGFSEEDITLIKQVSAEIDKINTDLNNLGDKYNASAITNANEKLETQRKLLEDIYIRSVKNAAFTNLKNAGVSSTFDLTLLSDKESNTILESFARMKLLTDALNSTTAEAKRNYRANLQALAAEERSQEVRLSALATKTFGGQLGLINEVFATSFDNLDFSRFTSRSREAIVTVAFALKTALADALRAGGEGVEKIASLTKEVFNKLDLVSLFLDTQERIENLSDTNVKDAISRIQELSGFDIELDAYLKFDSNAQLEFERFLEKASALEQLSLKRNLPEDVQSKLNELVITGDVEGIYDSLAQSMPELFEGIQDPLVIALGTTTEAINALINSLDSLRPKAYATGGNVSGPGTGTSDSILAKLSNGEFVVNAKATKENRALLESINNGSIPKFKDGGLVEEKGFLGNIKDYGTGFAKGLYNQFEALVEIAKNPKEFAEGIAGLGKQLYNEPIETVSTMAGLAGNAIKGAFQSPYAMGQFVGENINPFTKLSRINKTNLDVYHGSLEIFDKFDNAFVGSQHGNAFGKGHYFTDNFESAKIWAESGTPIRYIDETGAILPTDSTRYIYKVHLDDAIVKDFLDLDKRIPMFARNGLKLNKHPIQRYIDELEAVKSSFRRFGLKGHDLAPGKSTFDMPHNMIEGLRRQGIYGSKHKFTRFNNNEINYVLFDGRHAQILDRRAVPLIDLPNYPQFNTGGLIKGPGTGTSDSIIARVSNGESIITADATKKYWPMLKAMNAGKELPAFNKGHVAGSGSIRNAALIETLDKYIELAQSQTDIFAKANILGGISGASLSLADANKIEFEDLVNITSLQEGAATAKRAFESIKFTGTADEIVAAQLKYQESLRAAEDAIAIALENFGEKVEQNAKAFASTMTDTINTNVAEVLKTGSNKDFFKNIADKFAEGIIDSFVKGLTEPFRKDFERYMTEISENVMSLVAGKDGKGGIISYFKGKKSEEEVSDDAFLPNINAPFEPTLGTLTEDPFKKATAGFGMPPSLAPSLAEFGPEVGTPAVVEAPGLDTTLDMGLEGLNATTAGVGQLVANAGKEQGGLLGMILSFIPTIITLLGVKSFFSSGGPVTGPGTGTSDSILARISNGEYVINAKSTKRYLPLIKAINNGSLKNFATGGMVSDTFVPPNSMPILNEGIPKNSSQQVFNIQFTGDISRQTKAEMLRMLPQLASGVNSYNKEMGYKG